MTISVKAKTGKKLEVVKLLPDGVYEVSVKSQPIDGKANEAIIAILADYFKVAKCDITLLNGHTNSHKRFDIANN